MSVETVIRASVGKGLNLIAGVNRARSRAEIADHPFLTGVHQPMTEEKSLTELAFTGVIPAALDGRYLRIGPNPIEPDAAGHHWFVGDGMVHGLAIRDGKPLWYRNRWIRSKSVSRALGESPTPGPRREMSDTVNTNVVAIAGRTWALVESGAFPVELSDDLETQAHNPFDGTLTGAFTAHPHRDPLTGEHHAITYDPMQPDLVHHIVVSDEGKVVGDTPIPVKDGPSIHDCAFTARFVIILDLPVTFSMRAMVGGHRFPFGWNPAHQARLGLLPRAGTAADIIWCDVEPCYVFHAANAYDLPDGRVILDVVAYDTMFADSHQGPDASGRLERWTISPASRSVERQVIDASPQEFPRPDERRLGQPYRYAYSIEVAADDRQLSGGTRVYKHDLDRGTRQTHDFGAGRLPGEFVFVPESPEAAEDAGWLIGLVVDTAQATTDLVILDARDVAAPPIASIHLQHQIPAGFHGNWLPRRSAR